jgi:cation diffusion facilitator family transporter
MQPRTLLKLSVAVAVATMALKTLAWWLTGSVGLLSDAMESGVNLVSAMFALAMVTIAARPADEDHPFGHTKAEYFSSGFEGMAIAVAAAAILWAAGHRLLNPQPLQGLDWGLALAVFASALNGLLAWRMLIGAREHRSIALEADARHLMTDVWTSAGVVVGLLLVAVTGWQWLDPLLAIGVAINILREGVLLAWRSVDGLMDTAVEPEVQAQIDAALAPFRGESIRFDHLVTRRAGHRRFVDLHMHMPANWTLGRAAAVRADVEGALTGAVPGLRASIQLLPANVESQFAEEREPA